MEISITDAILAIATLLSAVWSYRLFEDETALRDMLPLALTASLVLSVASFFIVPIALIGVAFVAMCAIVAISDQQLMFSNVVTQRDNCKTIIKAQQRAIKSYKAELSEAAAMIDTLKPALRTAQIEIEAAQRFIKHRLDSSQASIELIKRLESTARDCAEIQSGAVYEVA